ncbi:MAG: Ldh family oxidoreductase [bacterium]
MTKTILIPAAELVDFGAAVLSAAGVPPSDARKTAEILADANLRGVDTHGIYLVNLYAKRIKKGLINPTPKFRFEKKRAGAGVLDADFSLGQLSSLEAALRAVDMARDCGIAAVTVVNSNHFGAAAYYTETMARSGCIGIALSNGESDVVPFGGREKFLGTNPLSVCVPAGRQPWFLMDMATSEVAFGKVRAAAEAGAPIPPNWAVDREGRPVTDPAKAYAVVPMAGAKGYAISALIEILSSRLTGMPFGAHIVRKFDDWDNRAFLGHFFQAIDIEAFCPAQTFRDRMDEFFEELKNQPAAPGFNEILIPGEPEERRKRQRLSGGCPIRAEDAELLRKLGDDFGVKFPGA